MTPNSENIRMADFFTALSHKRRLMICDILIAQGANGINFDRLCKRASMNASTLTHHLRQMEKGGILKRRPKGNETWLSIDFATICLTPNEFVTARKRSLDPCMHTLPAS